MCCAFQADQLADAAKQRRELADEATERARSLPGTIKVRARAQTTFNTYVYEMSLPWSTENGFLRRNLSS